MDKREVYGFITDAVMYGNLGIFTGAGFSKAVLIDNRRINALSWGELLNECCTKMGLKYMDFDNKHVTYPQIASLICTKYANDKAIFYDEAVQKFKEMISILTNWYPTNEMREKYYQYFSSMQVKWFLTTNYDMLLEAVLSGEGLPLGPADRLIAPISKIPIYHLHGIRINPESIVITQEDYLSLFRPGEYRQLKLPLLIKESTVLLVGYGLGDINVLTALDWSKNVFNQKGSMNYPQHVIQLLYTGEMGKENYYEKDGIIILETNDLEKTFQEIATLSVAAKKNKDAVMTSIDALKNRFMTLNESMITQFIISEGYRQAIIKQLEGQEEYLTPSFLYFLGKIIDDLKGKSRQPTQCSYYKPWLAIIIDVILFIDVKKMPTALFSLLMNSFGTVAPYIGTTKKRGKRGHIREAGKYWEEKKDSIPPESINAMREYFSQKWWLRDAKCLLEFDAKGRSDRLPNLKFIK